MARYSNGINGPFSGGIGPVIGSSRNGVPYMKGKGDPRTSKTSEPEQANRNKFSTATAWLKPLLPLLRVGFQGYSRTSYGFIAAKSYTLLNSMENGEVLPERVKVSIGDLPLSADLTVSVKEGRNLQFNWATDHVETASGKDQLMLLIYHPESQTSIYEIHGAFRETGMQVIHLVSDFIDKTIHVYAAFVAADRSRQSESVYFDPIFVV